MGKFNDRSQLFSNTEYAISSWRVLLQLQLFDIITKICCHEIWPIFWMRFAPISSGLPSQTTHPYGFPKVPNIQKNLIIWLHNLITIFHIQYYISWIHPLHTVIPLHVLYMFHHLEILVCSVGFWEFLFIILLSIIFVHHWILESIIEFCWSLYHCAYSGNIIIS